MAWCRSSRSMYEYSGPASTISAMFRPRWRESPRCARRCQRCPLAPAPAARRRRFPRGAVRSVSIASLVSSDTVIPRRSASWRSRASRSSGSLTVVLCMYASMPRLAALVRSRSRGAVLDALLEIQGRVDVCQRHREAGLRCRTPRVPSACQRTASTPAAGAELTGPGRVYGVDSRLHRRRHLATPDTLGDP